jgi:hypothetical protein
MNEKVLGQICFYLGFVSIVASIAIWFLTKTPDPLIPFSTHALMEKDLEFSLVFGLQPFLLWQIGGSEKN